MKRSPIKRKKSLRRVRMKRKAPRRLSRPGADPHYVSWSHLQPCVGVAAIPGHICEGRITFSHERNPIVDGVKKLTGAGMKAPDRRGCTKCMRLHVQWEEHRGYFAGWSDVERFGWMDTQITVQNANYLLAGYVFADGDGLLPEAA